ncbi:MAG: adenosylhomocysteinase [Aciduliprofundum sp.]|nr:adenosylhomocysteinase [Thermoplasmatales archaeon]PMP73991.1 MAG: adenosylhomocysteinase [Aciduliprofundum sp.]
MLYLFMANINEGRQKIYWAESRMGIISTVRENFRKNMPFKGIKIGMALHLEAKTAVLAKTLKEGGAEVYITSCNPLTTDDDVASSLSEIMHVYAKRGQTRDEYYESLNKVLDAEPDIIIDDGGDLTTLLHTERNLKIMGGNEETTTGVMRLKIMEKDGVLKFPMFDVNDAEMKHLFDNRYGTGQSTIDGIMSTTNLLIAGKNAVVAGYGWCGRGIASRLRGMGAKVTVTEVDPVKAIEAHMDGFHVKRMEDAIKDADIVITATGVKDIVRKEHFLRAKNGCIFANSGHFDVEINKNDLMSLSREVKSVRRYVDEYTLHDGRRLYLLGEGRLINLVGGQGHPVEIMDLSFSIQALTAEYIVKNHAKLEKRVYPVPKEIDRGVAEIALKVFGIQKDELTEEQVKYINSWNVGT